MDDKWIIEIPRGQRPGQKPQPPHYYGVGRDGLGCFTSRNNAFEFDTEAQALDVMQKFRWTDHGQIKKISET